MLHLKWETTWCQRHWQPFLEGKTGGIVLTVKFNQIALAHPVIYQETGGDIEKAERVLADHAPLCCLLGEDYVRRAMEWLDQEHCMVHIEKNVPCHKPKGHAGDCNHFWPNLES